MNKKLLVTKEAEQIINSLKEKHGLLMFHQSGGCCDGSAPMCFPEGELLINETDVLLGTIVGCNYYISKDQYDYWRHTQITIDITKGMGSSFSLEIPLGIRFIIKSSLLKN